MMDTPAFKVTYSAKVKVLKEFVVAMSANKTNVVESGDHKIYEFSCTIPIPSYLLAIAVGNIAEKKVGARTFVMAEPDQLDRCADELVDLEKFLITAETYLTPYEWGTYAILILPPSFPYGGMENPLLTFASPTIIVGDKSGVAVAIHEIAHSWSGNLFTNQNWENMWINEGFTVFTERKVSELLNTPEFSLINS